MKKVFPSTLSAKRLARKTIDLFSAVIVVATIGILATSTVLAQKSADMSSAASGYAIYKGEPKEEKASVMFNVYEGAENVMQILEILREFGAKATFFIGGIWAEKNAETLLRIVSEGHELGCHGYLHRDHSVMSVEQNKEEIAICCNLIRAVTGVTVTLFAPPSGAYGKNTEEACRSLGMKLIMWTKDTIDWRDADIDLLVSRATKNISKGDLILMHPKPQSVEALPRILAAYNEKGIALATVSDTIT